MQLYKYAETLFEEQARLVTKNPEGFRFHEATCTKCDELEQAHNILEVANNHLKVSSNLEK